MILAGFCALADF